MSVKLNFYKCNTAQHRVVRKFS